MDNLVSIIVGSDSDLEYAKNCSETLKKLSIKHSINVLSAHRSPKLVEEHIKKCEQQGVKVFIAMAGLAAHLAGAVASKTTQPVIGVPLDGGPLKGIDSLLSTVQMPKGIPVATVTIGSTGAINAAYLSAQILGIESESISKDLKEVRNKAEQSIGEINKELGS